MAESVRLVATGPSERTYRRPSGSHAPKPPATIAAEAGAMLSIDRIGMPPALLAALKHVASLHNPAYYEKERLRLSTWKTPRLLRCYGETLDRLMLPRGLREAAGHSAKGAPTRFESTPDQEVLGGFSRVSDHA